MRYGELDPQGITVKKGDPVVKGQLIGKTGNLTENNKPLMTLGGNPVFMLHFELYTGVSGADLVKAPLSNNKKPPFMRRADMIDPLEFLKLIIPLNENK